MECFYREFLLKEFERRKRANGSYSLRAFAKALDVSVSVLSRAFDGEREISVETAKKISAALKLNRQETASFLRSVSEQQRKFVRKQTELIGDADAGSDKWKTIESEQFEKMSDWRYYAIVEAFSLSAPASSFESILKKLGISKSDGTRIAEELVEAGLLRKGTNGGYQKPRKFARIANLSKSSDAQRQHQRQFLEHSRRALETIPIERRVHMSAMLAIDPRKMERARFLLDEFVKNLAEVAGTEPRTKVYWFGCSLFPLSDSERDF